MNTEQESESSMSGADRCYEEGRRAKCNRVIELEWSGKASLRR